MIFCKDFKKPQRGALPRRGLCPEGQDGCCGRDRLGYGRVRPGGAEAGHVGQLPLTAAVGVHEVDLGAAVAGKALGVCDHRTVRRPVGFEAETVGCQLHSRTTAVGVDDVDVSVRDGDSCAVRRPSECCA